MTSRKLLSLAVALVLAFGVLGSLPVRDVSAAPAKIKVQKRTDFSPFYSVSRDLTAIRGLYDDFRYPVVVSNAPFAHAINQELNQLLYDIAAEMTELVNVDPWYAPSIRANFYKRITKKTFSLAVFVDYGGPVGTFPHAERVFHYDRKTDKRISFNEVQKLNGRDPLAEYEIAETLYQKGRQYATAFNNSGDCSRSNMGDVFQASNLYLRYADPERANLFFQRKENRGSLATDIYTMISAGVYPDRMRVVNNRQLTDNLLNPAYRRLVDRLDLKPQTDLLVLEITDAVVKGGKAQGPEHAAFGQRVYELLTGEGVDQYRHVTDLYPDGFQGERETAPDRRLLLLVPRERNVVLFYTNADTALDRGEHPTFHPPLAPHVHLMSFTDWKVDPQHPVAGHPVTLLTADGRRDLYFHGEDPGDVDLVKMTSDELLERIHAPQSPALHRMFLDQKLPGKLKGTYELMKFKEDEGDYAVANDALQQLHDTFLARVKQDKAARAIVFQEVYEDDAWISLHTRVRLSGLAQSLNFIIDKKTGKFVTEREILKRFDIKPDKLETYLERSADFNFLGDFGPTVAPLRDRGETRIGDHAFWLTGDGLLAVSCEVTNDCGSAPQDFILLLPH